MSSPVLPSRSVPAPAPPGCPALAATAHLGPSTQVMARHHRWQRSALAASERGMTTAEYAVGTVAACGFGGVLYKVVTSDVVAGLLEEIVRRALTLSF